MSTCTLSGTLSRVLSTQSLLCMGAELTPESAEVLEEARGEDWDSGGWTGVLPGQHRGAGPRSLQRRGLASVLVTTSGGGTGQGFEGEPERTLGVGG